ncbi:titin-like [Uranotaenia lowii]|uniref:titin-like n=1 Tax=Uranotaenia lowii TaxID=190385 RepID=UPI00247B06D1|nr:titin-like [Uranotaenia lowii]
MVKNMLLVLLPLLIASASAVKDPRCTQYSSNSEAKTLPHRSDCSKFYMCDMVGNAMEMQCPPNTFYSVAEGVCSFDDSSCSGMGYIPVIRPVQPEVNNRVPVVKPVLPEVPIVKPIEPEFNNKFPIVKPALPEFIPEIKPVQPEVKPVKPEVESPELATDANALACADLPSGTTLPQRNDCHSYIICIQNRAIALRCPEGLAYDVHNQKCDFETELICQQPYLTESNSPVEKPHQEQNGFNRPQWETPINMPQIPVVPIVPPQQPLPMPEHSVIIPPQETVSGQEFQPYNPVINPDVRCLIRADPDNPIILPHTRDCSKYLVCVGGGTVEKYCPAGQHWSVENNWCDYPFRARCVL